jgi:hypothetical protein
MNWSARIFVREALVYKLRERWRFLTFHENGRLAFSEYDVTLVLCGNPIERSAVVGAEFCKKVFTSK